MKKKLEKIQLHRETLRHLDDATMGEVAGGWPYSYTTVCACGHCNTKVPQCL
jgi:hypothetical protein